MHFAVFGKRDNADKACGAIWNAGEVSEKQFVVLVVCCVRPGVARGVDAGCAIERIDGEPGVVGEEEAGREAAVIGRFQAGVFFEGRAGFFGRQGWF